MVFKIKDWKGFKSDPLIRKVSSKFQNNYNFKHIIKGNYLFTPDLTKLLSKKSPSEIKREVYPFIHILTLYKYAVLKGYIQFYKVVGRPDNPTHLLPLSALVKYILNDNETTVLELLWPLKVKWYGDAPDIYLKFKVYVETDNFLQEKPITVQLLEMPISKISTLFKKEVTTEYYIIRGGKLVKMFEIKNDVLPEEIETKLSQPPVLPLVEYYIKTGKLIDVKGCSPQEHLIKNFNYLITGERSRCIFYKDNDPYAPQEKTVNWSKKKYKEVILYRRGNHKAFEQNFEQYYFLLKNLVTVHLYLAKEFYRMGVRDVKSFFNPPVSAVKRLILQEIHSPENMPFEIKLIWKSINVKGKEIPVLIILEVIYDEDYKKYFIVYNNVFYSLSVNAKYFRFQSLKYPDDRLYYFHHNFMNGQFVSIMVV